MLRLFLRFFGPPWSVAEQIRLYILHCSIFSPQLQDLSCNWVVSFLSVAKKLSTQPRGVFCMLTNCKQSRFPLPKIEKI